MGSFNPLRTVLACPRCGVSGEVEVEMRFGDTSQMQELSLHDRYPWVARKMPQHDGRPPGGNVDGEGYLECQHCHRDSFLRVIIREDIVVGVEPDFTQRGFIAD